MHTTRYNKDGHDIVFLHNGDYSGEVTIRHYVPQRVSSDVVDKVEHVIKIPFDALLQLVANYVAQNKIAELEQADHKTILGIKEISPTCPVSPVKPTSDACSQCGAVIVLRCKCAINHRICAKGHEVVRCEIHGDVQALKTKDHSHSVCSRCYREDENGHPTPIFGGSQIPKLRGVSADHYTGLPGGG